jgi:hypothetical protein
MTREELISFNFDTYERIMALAGAVETLEISPESLLLDVGGRPGVLARLLEPRKLITADLPTVSRKPYVRASGAALPFKSNSFECVIASDTLEHVPQQHRENFLTELSRVSQEYLLISGPYNTPAVKLAEDKIRFIERESPTQATEWLAEHEQYGLPSLTQTEAFFKQLGSGTAIIPGGSVVRWFILFAAQSLLEGIPGGGEALKKLMPNYNRLFASDSANEPAYRHLLVVSKTNRRLNAFGESALNFEKSAMVEAKIEALGGFADELADSFRLRSEGSGNSPSINAAYLDQLERALGQQEQRLIQLKQHQGLFAKIRRKIGIGK